MKTVHYSIFAILLSMVGCASVQCSTVHGQNQTVQHRYEISVVDVDGNPLEGVKIEYTLKDRDTVVESSAYTTASDGFLRKDLSATIDPRYLYPRTYKSEFEFKATKNGYYPKSGKLSSKYGTEDFYGKPPVEEDKITLIQPIDYFNKKFASTISDAKLKTRVLSFIDLIILQGLVAESVLEMRSVNLVSFKGNNYLQFKFTNVNIYNSLKLNKYDIGKRLFDEVIRKVLSPLNEYIGNSNLFYGYDLTVVGHTKDFAEYATAKPIEYRFMIPESVVRKYKNKDISGQQVLDKSVILMDDERVELKLQ